MSKEDIRRLLANGIALLAATGDRTGRQMRAMLNGASNGRHHEEGPSSKAARRFFCSRWGFLRGSRRAEDREQQQAPRREKKQSFEVARQ
jgi:hypothetical protein